MTSAHKTRSRVIIKSELFTIKLLLLTEDDSNESTYNAHSSKSNTGTHPNLWDSSGTGSRIFGSQNVKTKQQESRKKITTPPKKV